MTIATDAGVKPTVSLDFEDNRLLPLLFGAYNENLARMERNLGVSLSCRGNRVEANGPAHEVSIAKTALEALYHQVRHGREIDYADVDAAIRMAADGELHDGAEWTAQSEARKSRKIIETLSGAETTIGTRKRLVTPRSPRQADYIKALKTNELVFGLGPSGTGKTYLAVAVAVSLLTEGAVERIILSRPAVEAGERLGFLPGDMRDKIDPYLRPLYDALYEMMPADRVAKKLESGEIEIAPLAFMRGRTLANAYVILDEAQNATPVQMKMFLTRLGEGARMAITGDRSQIDLPRGAQSGLREAVGILGKVKGVRVLEFGGEDVVRHPLVTRIIAAYEAHDKALESKGEEQ